MASGGFRFEGFLLDPEDRRLSRDGAAVELSGRYFDALALLVRERGRLVSKDRFLDEVWHGVPVTDEALTQCVKTLRRQLGDSAGRPRFIETVPKHGYRFIAAVEEGEGTIEPEPRRVPRGGYGWREFLLTGGAGVIGGGVAGLLGGLVYGFGGAAQPLQEGMGATSVLLVMVCLTIAVAVVGALGVGFGIAAAGFASRRLWQWSILGGGAGGLLVGAIVKLLGTDAFQLLFGRSPGDITGAGEGVLLGAAVGLGAWLGRSGARDLRLRRGVAAAGLAGGAAGAVIALLGGRLLGGSLDLVATRFPESRFSLAPIGSLFGEAGFGPVTRVATGAMEGLLFGACVVGAMIVARRQIEGP